MLRRLFWQTEFPPRALWEDLLPPLTRVYVASMAVIGIASWFYRSFLYDRLHPETAATIESLSEPSSGVVDIVLRLTTPDTFSYKPGQFAFFRFPSLSKSEQHPFTLSSHPDDETLRITVKALGDYTSTIGRLKPGDEAFVDGPFGHFTSEYAKAPKQVWLAGGIGITPFLSLARDLGERQVKLFWSVRDADEAAHRPELRSLSGTQPNLEFTLWDSSDKGYISLDGLGLDDTADTEFMLCGPPALKSALTQQLMAKGVKSGWIHDEEFAFR